MSHVLLKGFNELWSKEAVIEFISHFVGEDEFLQSEVINVSTSKYMVRLHRSSSGLAFKGKRIAEREMFVKGSSKLAGTTITGEIVSNDEFVAAVKEERRRRRSPTPERSHHKNRESRNRHKSSRSNSHNTSRHQDRSKQRYESRSRSRSRFNRYSSSSSRSPTPRSHSPKRQRSRSQSKRQRSRSKANNRQRSRSQSLKRQRTPLKETGQNEVIKKRGNYDDKSLKTSKLSSTSNMKPIKLSPVLFHSIDSNSPNIVESPDGNKKFWLVPIKNEDEMEGIEYLTPKTTEPIVLKTTEPKATEPKATKPKATESKTTEPIINLTEDNVPSKNPSDKFDPHFYDNDCSCGLVNGGNKMVSCDACKRWWHAVCVKVTFEDELPGLWYCLDCRELRKIDKNPQSDDFSKTNDALQHFVLYPFVKKLSDNFSRGLVKLISGKFVPILDALSLPPEQIAKPPMTTTETSFTTLMHNNMNFTSSGKTSSYYEIFIRSYANDCFMLLHHETRNSQMSKQDIYNCVARLKIVSDKLVSCDTAAFNTSAYGNLEMDTIFDLVHILKRMYFHLLIRGINFDNRFFSYPLEAIRILRSMRVELSTGFDFIFPKNKSDDNQWHNYMSIVFQTPNVLQDHLTKVREMLEDHKHLAKVVVQLKQLETSLIFMMKLKLLYTVVYSNTTAPIKSIEVLKDLREYFKRNKINDNGVAVSTLLLETLKDLVRVLEENKSMAIAARSATLICEALRDLMRAMKCQSATQSDTLLRMIYDGCYYNNLECSWLSASSITFLPTPVKPSYFRGSHTFKEMETCGQCGQVVEKSQMDGHLQAQCLGNNPELLK